MTPIDPASNTTVAIPLPKMPGGRDAHKAAPASKDKDSNSGNIAQPSGSVKSSQGSANAAVEKKTAVPALPSMPEKRESSGQNNGPLDVQKATASDNTLSNTQKTKAGVRRRALGA